VRPELLILIPPKTRPPASRLTFSGSEQVFLILNKHITITNSLLRMMHMIMKLKSQRTIRLTYNKVLDSNEVKLGQQVTNLKILFVKRQALLCNLVIDTNKRLHNY